jgi:hypothetical protein
MRAPEHGENLRHAAALVLRICRLAGHFMLIEDAQAQFEREGIQQAIQEHDDALLFEWLMESFSFQGVSDAIASSYMDRHGRVAASDIFKGLETDRCPKLKSYWHFEACGYRKSKNSCSEFNFHSRCSLPRHDLRNGRLNQTAYSLFLFLRDAAGGDFVTWLDRTLSEADRTTGAYRGARLARAVVEPMSHIYGVSYKVLTMSLSLLLLAGDNRRERWTATGSAMIAVDTLVHNWLHRSGVLGRLNAKHAYGIACYRENGCAEILARLSAMIDATEFNPSFPKSFPRFVQHAIWNFCSQPGLDICNGNRIDDRTRCANVTCLLFDRCDRIALRKPDLTS